MSEVTDILLCTAIEDGATKDGEHPNADALSLWLVSNYGKMCAMEKVDGIAGGDKNMQSDVFMVAVNHCDHDALITAFMEIEWESPEKAQLMVKRESWDGFRIFSAMGTDRAYRSTE